MPTVNDQTNVCKKKSAVRCIACEGFFLGLQTVWQKIEKEVMDLLQQLAPKFATAVFFFTDGSRVGQSWCKGSSNIIFICHVDVEDLQIHAKDVKLKSNLTWKQDVSMPKDNRRKPGRLQPTIATSACEIILPSGMLFCLLCFGGHLRISVVVLFMVLPSFFPKPLDQHRYVSNFSSLMWNIKPSNPGLRQQQRHLSEIGRECIWECQRQGQGHFHKCSRSIASKCSSNPDVLIII